MKPHRHPASFSLPPSGFQAFSTAAFRLSGFSLGAALAVCALSTLNAAQPSLDVFLPGNATGEIATFKTGARLFSNRNYTLLKPPAALNGMSFLRAPLTGGMEIRCTAPGEILVLTPDVSQPNSLAPFLHSRGFTKDASISEFQLFGDKPNNRVLLHRKTLAAGETLKLGQWSIVLGFASANFKRAAAREFGPPPGIVIDKSPNFETDYIGSPSIAILPDGTYVASHDWFGRSPNNHQTVILTSTDKGKTWKKQAEFPFFWATLFVHKGNLYIIGSLRPFPSKSSANIAPFSHYAIRRSTDGGKTWTTPVDSKTGLIRADALYQTNCRIFIHNGRIWNGFEVMMTPEETLKHAPKTGFAYYFRSHVASVPVDADLLDAANWTFSEPFHYDYTNWPVGSGFLEGNVIVGPDGKLVNILRCEARGQDKAIILDVSEDGKRMFSRGKASQIDFPGGSVKFNIRFDPVSKRYWTLATQQKNPPAFRNYLVLLASDDLVNWEQRAVLLRHPDQTNHAFQYVDWLFDGDDILYVSRTAWGNSHNAHDANYITLHRAKNFRSLTEDAPWLGEKENQ